jgi:hypothetical protein
VDHGELAEDGPQRAPSTWRRLRNIVIVVVIVAGGVALIGHIGRSKVNGDDLEAGMCIRIPTGSFSSTDRIGCTKPHDAEVIGWVNNVDTVFGEDQEALNKCASVFETFAGSSANPSPYSVGYFIENATKGMSGRAVCYAKSGTGGRLSQPLARP